MSVFVFRATGKYLKHHMPYTPVKTTQSACMDSMCQAHSTSCFVIHFQMLIWNRSDIDDHERICEFCSEVVRWICVSKPPHVMMGLDTGPEGRRTIALLYFAEKRLSFWPHNLFERFIQSIRMRTPTQRIQLSVWNINECQELLLRGVFSNF